MPWLETWPMEQRVDFVRECREGVFTMTELAAQYRISRKTGYKWLRGTRWRVCSACRSLAAPAPQSAGHGAKLLAALVAVRKRHPHWGAKKLLTVAARRAPTADWPRPSDRRIDPFAGAAVDRASPPPKPSSPASAERPAGDHGGE